ncbi:MAG: CBS domain-containing protein [Chloroflexi bacterium]|nr:CBS domain-containing protein [Chloroflexota bacterium]
MLDRFEPSGQLVLILLAVLVGVGTAFGAVAFVWLLARVAEFTTSVRTNIGSGIGLLLVMGTAGLLVGYMIDRWAREAKGHGVPEVMEAMVMRGGRIRPRVAAVKVFASSLTIGSGGSAGREGPIVQVGSALGSTLGQLFRFSNDRIRTLVACGAAAGIAATFNAPIAGSLFALEVILGRFTARYFGAVVVSAVSASIIARAYLGDRPAFDVPAYSLNQPAELLLYLLLGILAAFLAVAFIRMLYRTEGLFDRWKVPLPVKTSLGMLLTAAVGLVLAEGQVLGPGLHMIGVAIGDDFQVSLGLMALLLVLKLLATLFTLGSGNSGGVFAPSLFMGALLGGIVGQVAGLVWPGVVLHPGAYALVGMAATFAGAAHAPMTAILIVFEMSSDYRLILPLMLATVVATLIAELLFNESIYSLKLKLKGIALQRGRNVDILQGVLVGEIMSEPNTVNAAAALGDVAELVTRQHENALLIVDNSQHLEGIISLSDIERAIENQVADNEIVSNVGTARHDLLIAFPDETVAEALTRMSGRGLGVLPVVSRENANRLIGQIKRGDILRSYDLALTRRTEVENRAEQLRNQAGADFTEFHLSIAHSASGKTLKEIGQRLPRGCVVVSIHRKEGVIVPHGDTRFEAGDKITVYATEEDLEAVRACFT